MSRTAATVMGVMAFVGLAGRVHERPARTQQHLLAEALRAGRSGAIKPYELRETARVNGAVYTPFIRVAMLSRAAWMRGQDLSLEDVPPSISEPLTYFVMRWSEDHDSARVLEYTSRQPLQVTMVPTGHAPGPDDVAEIRPVWATEDLGVLLRFGAEKPFEDAAVVAAFSVEAVRPGFDVFVFVPISGAKLPPGVKTKNILRMGRITSEDAANWR